MKNIRKLDDKEVYYIACCGYRTKGVYELNHVLKCMEEVRRRKLTSSKVFPYESR